ncbi:MAG: hypothetical protein HOC71_14480, partial [Candidatus Latescibacteria bacterium]|nr:hypothetical protein [Candidatus Latescibacterota bacterium]
MKSRRFTVIVTVCAVFLILAGTAKSDRARRQGFSRPMMMTKIFEKAGCPLDESQIEQIKNLEPGPEKREAFLTILNADQKEAFKNTRLKKGDRAPRHMMMTKIFEKAGCPLTEAQIEQIKNIEPGPEKHDAFLAILNADQKEALKDTRLKKGDRAPRHMMMTKIFEKAGCPLTEAQIEQIKNLEPGPEKHDAFLAILNADQKEALKDSRLKKGGRAPRHAMMTRILKKAGCPLDEAQIEQIKNLEPGPEKHEAFLTILNADQKEAFKNTRLKKGD